MEAIHAPSSKFIIALIIIVVVAAIVGALYFNFSKFQEETESVRAPAPVYAAQGEIVRGFPAELILDEGARVEQSYIIEYAPNLKQYTATYSSAASMTSLFSRYRQFFQTNGWDITNEITDQAASRGLYAHYIADEVSVAIIDGAASRQIIVSYVIK